MTDILDISSAIFNSGLEKDCIIFNGTNTFSGSCIYRNPYQRNGMMDINYESSNPFCICKYDMLDDWDAAITNTAVIQIEDENGGAAFKIREKRPVAPNYVILELSFD